jgi:hypothetical protein
MNKRTKDLIHALRYVAENCSAPYEWLRETERLPEMRHERAAAKKAIAILESLAAKAKRIEARHK